jgi:adenosine deaminase
MNDAVADSAAIKRLLKVELRLHLDCSLSFGLVSHLNPSISPKEFEMDFVASPQCASLVDFLIRAPRGVQLLQTAEALQLETEDAFEQLASNNIIYAELRFAPLLHLNRFT